MIYFPLFSSETKKENIADIMCDLFHYSGLIIMPIVIHKLSINCRHYMLADPVFHNLICSCYSTISSLS